MGHFTHLLPPEEVDSLDKLVIIDVVYKLAKMQQLQQNATYFRYIMLTFDILDGYSLPFMYLYVVRSILL